MGCCFPIDKRVEHFTKINEVDEKTFKFILSHYKDAGLSGVIYRGAINTINTKRMLEEF